MIEHGRFMEVWNHLLRRFGKPLDADQAAAYFGYLNDAGMDTEGFVQAARALWAESEFFPAPARFVTVRASAEWPLVLEAIEKCAQPAWAWSEVWPLLSSRAQDACRRLGGVPGMRAAYDRDSNVIRLQDRWEAEYAKAATADVLALPAGDAFPALPAERASGRGRGGLQPVGQLAAGAVPPVRS